MNNRRSFLQSLGITVAGLNLASISLGADSARRGSNPNVILIMADDLGYNDLSCYGSEKLHTPVLDNMAAEGIRLTTFYTGCTVCTPSRMSLLTGAYPPRVGWKGGVIGWKMKGDKGLNPKALTIAEIFKNEGYETAISGKWHIGDTTPLLPNNQGFNEAYYIARSNNQVDSLWHNGNFVKKFDNRLLTEDFTSKAIEFIQKHKDDPFFLYLPFTAPHFPAQPHPEWEGHSGESQYGDVVEELDFRIGEIMSVLRSAGIDDGTLVVFLSDNGPEGNQKQWASARPYRGLKWSAMEGGYRVPCIARWPGVIPAGQECSEIVSAMDLLPTLARACDIRLDKYPDDSPKRDGLDVWSTFIGRSGAEHPRKELLYWHGWGDLKAIRVEDWKLFLEPNEKHMKGQGPALFNLREDPSESHDLSEQHPEKVAAMRKRANELRQDIEEHSMALGE